MEFCTKMCAKGHPCRGLMFENSCPPCLYCYQSNQKHTANDPCMICLSDQLPSAPCIELECGHIFHHACISRLLQNRWSGPRISFGFMLCPVCKVTINHVSLESDLYPIKQLYDDVRTKALTRLQFEGLFTSDAITTPGSPFYQNPAGFAIDRYAYYACSKCGKAYYGGEGRCENENSDDFNPDDLVCGSCIAASEIHNCPTHGTEYIEYKCRYCCSIAVFYCFGTTHFCNTCHSNHTTVTGMSKDKLPQCPAGPVGKQLTGSDCPLGINHPPTGDEFSLGCGMCSNVQCF